MIQIEQRKMHLNEIIHNVKLSTTAKIRNRCHFSFCKCPEFRTQAAELQNYRNCGNDLWQFDFICFATNIRSFSKHHRYTLTAAIIAIGVPNVIQMTIFFCFNVTHELKSHNNSAATQFWKHQKCTVHIIIN